MGGFGPPTQSFKSNLGIEGANDEMTFDLISNSNLTIDLISNSNLTMPNTTKPTSDSDPPASMFQLATQTTERNILCGHTTLRKRI